uniref:F-box domain-containing protein n=1 Tax=Araucaria cunninghamii TaxID=56994 RepID=A0A0D6QSA0_ARACU
MLYLARLPSGEKSQLDWTLVNTIFPVGHAGVFQRISLIQTGSKHKETTTAHAYQWFARPVSDKQFLSLAVPHAAGEIQVISISPSSGEILALVTNSERPILCKYSPASNAWDPLPAMKVLRDPLSFSGAVIGDYFYVAGGVRDNGRGMWLRKGLSKAERLDLRSNQWETIPDMHYPHVLGKGFALDGRFFVLHFLFVKRELCRSAEIFDPLTDQWTFVPDFLPNKVERFSMAVMKNELYMLKWSAAEPSGSLMRYEKSTGEWICVDSVPDPDRKYSLKRQLCPVGSELWVLDCGHSESWCRCHHVWCETSCWHISEAPSYCPKELQSSRNLEPHAFIHACKIGKESEAPVWRTIPIFRI